MTHEETVETKTTSSRDDEIHRLYTKEDKSMQEIGDEFGISRERVRKILAGFGITGEGNPTKLKSARDEERLAKIQEYVDSVEGHLTYIEVANHVGISPNLTRLVVLRAGSEELKARVGRTEPQHGTKSSYDHRSCRCDECKAANTEHFRKYRASLKEKTATV